MTRARLANLARPIILAEILRGPGQRPGGPQ
jgi:hypothetical protein